MWDLYWDRASVGMWRDNAFMHLRARARMFKNDGVLQASYYHMTSKPERYVGGRSSNQTRRGRDKCVASSLFLLIPGLKYSVP